MTFTLRERFHLWRAMRLYNPDGSFTPLETTTATRTAPLCPECNTGPGHWPRCSQYEQTTRKWWRWFLPPRKCAPCRLNIWHCHECNSTMSMNHTSVCSKRTSYKEKRGNPQAHLYGKPAQGKTYSEQPKPCPGCGNLMNPRLATCSTPCAEKADALVERANRRNADLGLVECNECHTAVSAVATHEQHFPYCSKHWSRSGETLDLLEEIERAKAKLCQTLAVPPEAVFKAGPIGPNHVPEQLDTVVIRDDTGHVRVHQQGSQHGWSVVAPGGYIPR